MAKVGVTDAGDIEQAGPAGATLHVRDTGCVNPPGTEGVRVIVDVAVPPAATDKLLELELMEKFAPVVGTSVSARTSMSSSLGSVMLLTVLVLSSPNR